jgi:hypothetical protein
MTTLCLEEAIRRSKTFSAGQIEAKLFKSQNFLKHKRGLVFFSEWSLVKQGGYNAIFLAKYYNSVTKLGSKI